MKNAYVFLIILVGCATYFAMRGQNNDMSGAQLVSIMCKRPNLPQIMIDICEGKKGFTQSFSQTAAPATGGTNPQTTIATFNKGAVIPITVTTQAPTPPTASIMPPIPKGIFVDANGTITQMPMPTYPSTPSWPSVMCSNWTMRLCVNNVCPRC